MSVVGVIVGGIDGQLSVDNNEKMTFSEKNIRNVHAWYIFWGSVLGVVELFGVVLVILLVKNFAISGKVATFVPANER